jgi:hypothetical protein
VKGKNRNVLTLHSLEVNKKVCASLSVGEQDDEYNVKGEGMCRIFVRTVNTRCINRRSDLIKIEKKGLKISEVSGCSLF